MTKTLSFEEAWRIYLGGSEQLASEQLQRCVTAATSVSELEQVFRTCKNHSPVPPKVRGPALKKMLELVSNVDEAQKVVSLASERGSQGYTFKQARLEALAKLESFK